MHNVIMKNTTCFLTDLPAELLAAIVSHLDIRSAGRLALVRKQLSAKCASRGSIILLQHHQDYPFFWAIERGDVDAAAKAYSRLKLLRDLRLRRRRRLLGPLVSLVKACIWVLLVDRNDGCAQLWSILAAIRFQADIQPTWIEFAVMAAYRRNHFSGIAAFGHLHSDFTTCDKAGCSLADLKSSFKEICAREPGPAFPTNIKLQLLQGILRIISAQKFDPPAFFAAITHPHNCPGIVIHLVVLYYLGTLFSSRFFPNQADCLTSLLDASDVHGRSDLVPVLMQQYLLGRRRQPRDPYPWDGGISPAPALVSAESVDMLLASTDAQMSTHGVTVETAIEFQDLLVHCSWHNHFIPWIIRISKRARNQQPHLAFAWFTAHVPLNMPLIHLLPRAAYYPSLADAQWPAHETPQHAHGHVLSHVSQVRSCSVCARIQHRAVSLVHHAGRSGSSSSSGTHALAKRLVQKPYHYVILYNGRPEPAVREEARALDELAGERDIRHASGAGHAVGWAGAIWAAVASVGGMFAALTRAG